MGPRSAQGASHVHCSPDKPRWRRQQRPADGGARTSRPTPAPVEALTLTPQRVIGEPGSGPAQFNEPHGVYVSPAGELYIVDSNNHRIFKLETK